MTDVLEVLLADLPPMRVQFWQCLVPEHRDRGRGHGEAPVVTVTWDGEVASCTAPGCGLTSAHTTAYADLVRTLAVPAATTTTEHALRYGDGDVNETAAKAEAHSLRHSLRTHIANGTYDRDDYEPMEVVTRTVTTYAPHETPWEPAP